MSVNVPKIKVSQQEFYDKIAERIENPPEPEPESRRLSAQENLNVILSTKEVCGRGRQMWNEDVLKRLLEGKQERTLVNKLLSLKVRGVE